MNDLIQAALDEIERRYKAADVKSMSNRELLELTQLLAAANALVAP